MGDDVKIKIDDRKGRYEIPYSERVYGTVVIFARNAEEAKKKYRDGDYDVDQNDSGDFECSTCDMEFQGYVD